MGSQRIKRLTYEAVKSREKVMAAVDVGATKVASGLFTQDLKVIFRQQLPTRTSPQGIADPGFHQTMRAVMSLIDFAQENSWSIAYGAMGVPEYVNADGQLLTRECIDWQLQPADQLPDISGFPWIIDSDVRCAALAEALVGIGQDTSSALYVTVSTGISSCLIVEHAAWTGHRGAAIGIGMFPATPHEADSTLEQYASGLGLTRRYNSAASIEAASAKEVVSRAVHDALAASIIHSAGESLGVALAISAELLDPEIIIMGGSLWENCNEYRNAAQIAYQRFHQHPTNAPTVMTGSLGHDRGLLGAAIRARSGID